jgi:hypothetical protein
VEGRVCRGVAAPYACWLGMADGWRGGASGSLNEGRGVELVVVDGGVGRVAACEGGRGGE